MREDLRGAATGVLLTTDRDDEAVRDDADVAVTLGLRMTWRNR